MATKEVTIRMTVPDAVRVSEMDAGAYFVPVLGVEAGVYRGVWQRVSDEAVEIPPGTYLSVCLGLLDGLANGGDPRYFDDSFMGHVLTKEQALALLAAQS